MDVKTVILFGIQAIGLVYSQSSLCNSVNGIQPLGLCMSVSGHPDILSMIYSCNVDGTGVLLTGFSDDACSGTVVYEFEDIDAEATCDGVTCDTFSVTNYHRRRDAPCVPFGMSDTTEINLGCVASPSDLQGESIFLQCNDADGGMAIFYESADCSGDPFAAVVGETGCYEGTYQVFDCASTGNERTIDASVPIYDDFGDLEEERPSQRPRTTRRGPRTTVAGLSVFQRELPGLEKLMQYGEATEEEAFVKQDGVSVRGIGKETVAMMFGVFALVSLVALMVYFFGGLKQKKALNQSQSSAPLANYGTVNA